jgi:hypothetical protein
LSAVRPFLLAPISFSSIGRLHWIRGAVLSKMVGSPPTPAHKLLVVVSWWGETGSSRMSWPSFAGPWGIQLLCWLPPARGPCWLSFCSPGVAVILCLALLSRIHEQLLYWSSVRLLPHGRGEPSGKWSVVTKLLQGFPDELAPCFQLKVEHRFQVVVAVVIPKRLSNLFIHRCSRDGM